MDILLAVQVILGLILAFAAGLLVNHALGAYFFRKRVCSIITADDHRREGERLIHEALHTLDKEFEIYLRTQAFFHFRIANQLENGPYKA